MRLRRKKKRRPPPQRRFPPEHYSHDECLALMDACGDTWSGQRNRALIALLWRSGLRLGEALAVMPKDIDWTGMAIRVLHGKGDKARTVNMDSHEAMVLTEWLKTRGEFPPTTPVICTRKGAALEQAYVRQLMPRLAQRAGVHKRVHAHGFRHTYAVDLMREGVNVRNIQVLLGHTSLAVTTVYLASLSPEEALDAVRGREW